MIIERPDSIPLGMSAAKALQMATAAMRRRYVLPETIEHPVVRAECFATGLSDPGLRFGISPARWTPCAEGHGKPFCSRQW